MKSNFEKKAEIFSSIDFIGQCLVDSERTKAFNKSISKSVKKGDMVADLGTGSGILSVFASKKGAKKVLAVEIDPFVADVAKNNFKSNKCDNISLVIGDATKISFSPETKFNVVISEMLTTGMVDEHQAKVVNNLYQKKYVDDNTVFIPERQDTFIALAQANFKSYGFSVSMVLHLWKWFDWRSYRIKLLSKPTILNSISFDKKIEEKFSKVLEIPVVKSGVVNAIHLSSISRLPGGVSIGDTVALNAPMLIPIKSRKVKAGDKIKLHIQYVFGGSYSNFKAKII